MKKVLASIGVGALTGGATYSTIGGIGLAISGTAVGITLIPMIAIGAGVGLAGSALYSLGKKKKRTEERTVGQLLRIIITGKGY